VPLAQIQYPPPTPQGLDEWFFSHREHHTALNQAITEKTGQNLQDFPIYPVQEDDLTGWNRAHQALHTQMNLALGIAGTDISTLSLKDKSKDNWFFEHFKQHEAAAQLCGQPV